MLTQRQAEVAFVLAVVVAGGVVGFFVIDSDTGLWATMAIPLAAFGLASIGISLIRRRSTGGREN